MSYVPARPHLRFASAVREARDAIQTVRSLRMGVKPLPRMQPYRSPMPVTCRECGRLHDLEQRVRTNTVAFWILAAGTMLGSAVNVVVAVWR